MLAKRLFDMIVSGLCMIALSPLFLLVAVLIKVTSSGLVFYRAERVGKNGRLFRLYKFRSMVISASHSGPGITQSDDPRVIPLGRWLRRLKIDELPQLVNVFTGDMSLVGPRPEDPRYVAAYTPQQRRILSVRPGITSTASVRYRHEESILAGHDDWEHVYLTVIMPEKLRIDIDYIEHRSFASDLLIIWQTFLVLFQ